MTKFLTIEDIVQELGISRTTAYKLVRQMKYSKIGRRILIAEEELMKFIQENAAFVQNNTKTEKNNKSIKNL